MGKVILYTSDTCSRCHVVKHMLDEHSVDYTEVTDRDYILSLGVEGVPALEVDGEIISEYPRVLSWLKKNRYYSFEVSDDDESN